MPGQLPKFKTFHIWWARRPLVASAGVVLASLLPQWTPGLASTFPGAVDLSSEPKYRAWFIKLCGILGDSTAAKRAQDAAIAAGVRIANPYSYSPALKNSPRQDDLALLHQVLIHGWGHLPNVLDPTAGGGSIPYAAARYGIPATANDLNAVAAAILNIGVRIPSAYGLSLLDDVRSFGATLVARTGSATTAILPVEGGGADCWLRVCSLY